MRARLIVQLRERLRLRLQRLNRRRRMRPGRAQLRALPGRYYHGRVKFWLRLLPALTRLDRLVQDPEPGLGTVAAVMVRTCPALRSAACEKGQAPPVR
jgi:hypothetical protein